MWTGDHIEVNSTVRHSSVCLERRKQFGQFRLPRLIFGTTQASPPATGLVRHRASPLVCGQHDRQTATTQLCRAVDDMHRCGGRAARRAVPPNSALSQPRASHAFHCLSRWPSVLPIPCPSSSPSSEARERQLRVRRLILFQ